MPEREGGGGNQLSPEMQRRIPRWGFLLVLLNEPSNGARLPLGNEEDLTLDS